MTVKYEVSKTSIGHQRPLLHATRTVHLCFVFISSLS